MYFPTLSLTNPGSHGGDNDGGDNEANLACLSNKQVWAQVGGGKAEKTTTGRVRVEALWVPGPIPVNAWAYSCECLVPYFIT